MSKYYQGRFKPRNPDKYRGDIKNIIYRSGWELRVMRFLDVTDAILEYSCEETIITYVSPLDGKKHRYFPDMYVKFRTKDGGTKEMLWEIKPLKQSVEPKMQQAVTRKYISEIMTYGVNKAKWDAAEEYCKDRGWEFKVVTEKDLGI
jgi:hypothetical protein